MLLLVGWCHNEKLCCQHGAGNQTLTDTAVGAPKLLHRKGTMLDIYSYRFLAISKTF